MASRNRSRSRTSSSSGAAISSSSGAGLNRVPSSTSLATSSSSSSTTHNSDPSSHTPPANVTEVLTLLHREIPSLRNEIRTLTDTNLSISSSISRSFDASKKANDRVASVYISDKELFAKQLDRIIKSHALTSSEIAKEKAAILAELENLSSSFKNEKATLTQALAASQGRIEGLLRDAAAREVLLATASTNLSPQQSQHQQAQPSVYALQNALHEAILLNTKEVAMLRNELSTLEKDSALLTERTDALRNSISTFSASSTAEASQLLENAGKREFALRDVIDSMTRQTNEALASSAAARASLEEDLAAAVRSANSAKESVNTLAASSYVEIDNARNVQEKALSSASLLRSSLLEVLSERDAMLSSLTTSLSEQVTSAKALGDSLAAREASHVKEERNREAEVTQLRETLINERAKFAEVEARLRVQVASANEASLDALRDKEVNDANALGNLHEIARKFAELERASASKEAEFVTVISDLRNALAASEQSVSAMRNSFLERSKNAESLLNRERSVFRASESAALLEVEKATSRYNSLLREREVERSETAESIRLLKKESDSKEDFYKSALAERDERIAALEASLSHAQARLVNATKISDKLGLGGGGGGGGAPGSMIERVSSLAKSSPSPLSGGGNYLSSQSPNVFTKTTSTLSSPQQHPQHQNHQNSSVIRTLSSSSSSLPYHQSAEEEGNAPASSSPGNIAVPPPSSSSSPLPYASSSSINKRYSSSSSSQFATSSTSKTLGTTTAFDDAHFLSLSHVFGACALSIAWAQERSLSLSTQSALAESIATLQRALLENEASSSVSIAVRDQHEMELHELRASVSELRDDNSRLLSALEPERALLLVKHEEMESGLSKAAEAFSTLSSSLSNALISLESLRSGLSQEGQVLKEANERDHLLFLSDSASLRNEVDTLRSTISIKTNEFVKDLEEVIKHRDQEISHLRSTASSESALAIETSRAQQLSLEALEESLRHSQEERAEKMALVETERAGFMSEVHILREECERLKKHDQERLAADKARASLYASELSRLANQNASIETEAANKVAESRKLFMRNVEERLEILRGEAQRARSTMRELNVAQDGRVAATTSLISSLTDTISGLVRSGVEVYKLSSVDNEATSALIVHMEKELVSVTNRFNAVRRTLEGEIDAARSALSGADKGGLIRIQSVLARAEPLLQRLSSASFSSSSSAGGAGASVEVSLLKVMVERLTALSNERKEVQSSSVANNNGGGISSSSSSSSDTAPLLAKYNAAMTDIQVQREREKERAVELSALKETLSKYRSAAQAAAQAAIEAAAAAATVAVSNPDSAVHQSQNSSSSSSFSSQQQQQQHIITQKGHGLTSPALMARVSMGGGEGDKDRDVLPPPIIPTQQQQQSETTTTQTVSINLDDTTGEDDEE